MNVNRWSYASKKKGFTLKSIFIFILFYLKCLPTFNVFPSPRLLYTWHLCSICCYKFPVGTFIQDLSTHRLSFNADAILYWFETCKVRLCFIASPGFEVGAKYGCHKEKQINVFEKLLFHCSAIRNIFSLIWDFHFSGTSWGWKKHQKIVKNGTF